jgi:hypothetical protein
LGMAPADPEPWTGSGAPDISKGAAPLGLPVVLGETLAREVGLP